MDEPVLDLDDIQGHVLIGFGASYQVLLGLKFLPGQVTAASGLLLQQVQVTPARSSAHARQLRRTLKVRAAPMPQPDAVAVAMGFSHAGLRQLGDFEGPEDIHFRSGAASAAKALLDEVDAQGRPVGWEFGADEATAPDVFIVLAAATRELVQSSAAGLLQALDGTMRLLFQECGNRLERDTEHFGFVDGISQPAPRGLVDGQPLIDRILPADDPLKEFYARPGQRLVWPGQYVFGYPTQQTDSEDPGAPAGAGEPLLQNGSLLVFRKLHQDVKAFRDAMRDLAASFSDDGLPVMPELAAAWCVGRWPDGTPVSLAPDSQDDALAGDSIRLNGFLYRSKWPAQTLVSAKGPTAFPGAGNDPRGENCPFFAHIRKVNPRDVPVDFGGTGATLRSQMLRRGLPYGAAWSEETSGDDRGLLFMSYQTSIENQFHRLMTLWVNSPSAPPPGPQAIDPVIGAPQGGRELIRRPRDQKNYRAPLPGRWVTAVGAGYFFMPGISALQRILQSGTAR